MIRIIIEVGRLQAVLRVAQSVGAVGLALALSVSGTGREPLAGVGQGPHGGEVAWVRLLGE
ncbi:hypothetical protein [Nonomuraea dietziae]|uniref:hypothetical protein n=1 Tax=Nonomuraea dietziae TaxID=65515 RepID=UPI0031DB5155